MVPVKSRGIINYSGSHLFYFGTSDMIINNN